MANTESKFNDSKYNLWGRKYPAVVSLTFPLLAIIYALYDKITTNQLSELESVFKVILFFGTIIPSLFFFYMMTIREISISILENLFDWLFGKPTSNLFLPGCNLISEKMKTSIKKKPKDSFKIDLDDASIVSDEKKADRRNRPYRQRINEAVSCMREIVRGNPILLEFNAIYGFFRNLAGGMLINLVLICIIYILNDKFNGIFGGEIVWSFCIVGTIFIMSLIFMITSRYRYAKRLFYLFDQYELPATV